MKITFHPPKAVILGRLGHELKETQASLDAAKAELVAVEEKANESKLHNPYLDQEKATKKSIVKAWEGKEEALQDTIGLIESCPEENLKAETEI